MISHQRSVRDYCGLLLPTALPIGRLADWQIGRLPGIQELVEKVGSGAQCVEKY